MSGSGWPVMPDFHPEFGLLCPSPRRRRGMRHAMVSIVTTMAIGASMGLAVAYWSDSQGVAATAQPMDEQPFDIPASARSVSGAGVDASPVKRVQESCKAGASKDPAALFLNRSCRARKLHARHDARATNRVAAVILGRMEAALAPAR